MEGKMTLEEVLKRFAHSYLAYYESRRPPMGLYDKMVSETERAAITVALEKTKGNQIKAAKILGINRNTLKSKMEKYKVGVSK